MLGVLQLSRDVTVSVFSGDAVGPVSAPVFAK